MAEGGAPVGGRMGGSEKAYYWGDFDTDAVVQVASIEWPGAKSVLSPQGLSGGSAINAVAVSPSGAQIAISGRDMPGGSFVLNVYNADGMGAPVSIVDAAQQPNTSAQIDNVAFSPDGSRIAYTADFSGSFLTGVYVSPANGSGPPKLVSHTPSGSLDAFGFVWAPDSLHLIYWGDLEVDLVAGIWSVDVTASTPAPVALVPASVLTADGDVRTNPQIDSQGRAYFKSTHDGAFYLYRNDVAGSNLEVVPGTDTLNNQNGQAEIGSFGLSAGGSHLAFSADSPDAGLYQVFVLDVNTTTAALVSNVTTTAPTTGNIGPDLNIPIAWRADLGMLAVQADWEDNDVFSAYLLPTSGNPGGLRILQATGSQDVKKVAFTSDSLRLVIRADLVTNDSEELFSTADFATMDQAALPLRVEEAATGSAEVYNFVIAP